MSQEATIREFSCASCGAKLEYAPGTTTLICRHCNTANPIPENGVKVHEEDFLAAIAHFKENSDKDECLVVVCPSCGAKTSLAANVTAARCPFCGTPIVAEGQQHRQIKPACLLPFGVTAEKAMQEYQDWLGGLWFAPSSLKRDALSGRLQGVYIPAWTYDSRAESDYTGERGEDYWDTETYTTTENGRSVTRTRQVRKTRWYPASGHVRNIFDDVLILATRSLPEKKAEALEPWDLPDLIPYQEEYLAGVVAQSYQVDLEEGFEEAKGIMAKTIEQTVRRDIGGDHQRIYSVQTGYNDISFKHLLLPVWLASYRYQEQVYRFMVNARTGEVQGERPWSWIKISLAVLGVILVILVIYVIYAMANQR